MLKKPELRACFRLEIFEHENKKRIFLLSERFSSECYDRIECLLLPLIDGQRTTDELVESALPHLVSENSSFQKTLTAGIQVYTALQRLEKKGYIVESEDADLPEAVSSFCATLGISLQLAQQRLQTTAIAVETIDSLPTDGLLKSLQSLSVRIAEAADLRVILSNDYLDERLAAINRAALLDERQWLLLKPVGHIVLLGPLFRPGQTACWECLAQRLRMNRSLEYELQQRKNIPLPLTTPAASLPSVSDTVLGLASTEILKWIVAGSQSPLEQAIISYDALTLQIQQHSLVRRPQCPACGESALKLSCSPLPVQLSGCDVTVTPANGYRCNNPEQTFVSYQHHISPITGVLRDLQRVSQPAGPAPVYLARYAWQSMNADTDSPYRERIGVCSGKGMSDVQARTAALCEGLERYSEMFHGDESRRRGSYQTLAELAIHPNACMNFSDTQYRQRESWNSQCLSPLQRVPEIFDEQREIDWTALWSLTENTFKYLPTAYCYHGYPLSPKADCWADSNGLAAGNTLEEAILHGILELIERDSVALWWYNRLPRPALDIGSFADSYYLSLRQYYHDLGRELWVLDITSDLAIPCFVAISRRVDAAAEDIIIGSAAHFDPCIALRSALSAVNEVLPAVLEKNADGSTRYLTAEAIARHWWQTATLANQPYLAPAPTLAAKDRADYQQIFSADLQKHIQHCKRLLEDKGMELLALDCTRPDIGLKTVKVFVPGLRHFWRRLGPGRLYQAPVQLGWLAEPYREDQLNPFPMWM